MSQRWYWAVEVDLAARRIRLEPEETTHLRQVLRHRTGDAIEAIDGRGGRYTVALLPARTGRDRGLEVEILTVHPPTPAPQPLVLCPPLIPWPRLEALIDGAIQLGVTHLWVWEANRARPVGAWSRTRSARFDRIARAATAQSLGTHLPQIVGPRPLPELLHALGECAIWVAHGPLPAEVTGEGRAAAAPTPGAKAGRALVVGPEGGLTEAEVELCLAAGARPLALGPRRLRTEVAAIAGLSVLRAADPGWVR